MTKAREAFAETISHELDMDMSPDFMRRIDVLLAVLWVRGFAIRSITQTADLNTSRGVASMTDTPALADEFERLLNAILWAYEHGDAEQPERDFLKFCEDNETTLVQRLRSSDAAYLRGREEMRDADMPPQHFLDIKSSLDAAQVVFETVVLDGDLPPREQTRVRLQAAIDAAVRAEREACARIADGYPDKFPCNLQASGMIRNGQHYGGRDIAAAIRASAATPQSSAPAPEKE